MCIRDRSSCHQDLDDMMIDGFQNVKEEFLKNEKIPDFRTAAYKTAIEKIALSYEFIGL